MHYPKFYRDPIHGQLRYEDADISEVIPPEPGEKQLSWLLRRLVDCTEFQRLRHIRQNGLTNLVFHGAEHSRFAHSMGVAYVAREMYDSVIRNTGDTADEQIRVATCAAGLVHDIGHGPFSHALEEILKEVDIPFKHENMTLRYIEDEDSKIYQNLREIDPSFPTTVASYIRKDRRQEEHWSHKIVSSQLDADRIDYLIRDAACAGIRGHGFDLPRLLDMLVYHNNSLAINIRAIEAVEAYILFLDQMYRAVYYHHAIRAATALLISILKRAYYIFNNGDSNIFGPNVNSIPSPLESLMTKGDKCEIRQYSRIGEFQVWTLIDEWRSHDDVVLSDLSNRLLARNLFKTLDIDPNDIIRVQNISKLAEELCISKLPHVTTDNVKYYVSIDQPSRTSYKRYDWGSEGPDESIWIIRQSGEACTIEQEGSNSQIIQAVKDKRYFHRLIFPHEIRKDLIEHHSE